MILTEIPRDRWGRPLIVPAEGGKPIGYTRATTFAGLLEDNTNLAKWKMRQTASGLAARPDILLGIRGAAGDKRTLDRLCEQAMEAAGAGVSATVGTALHGLTEQVDAGTLDLATVPAEYRADLEAYLDAVKGIPWIATEEFGVIDDLQVGGTLDRLGAVNRGIRVWDVKTGNIEYSIGKIAIQLAIYSRMTPYGVDKNGDPVRGTPNPQRCVDQNVATIIHLPAGQGRCELIDVDIREGWLAAQMAADVRAWRKKKGLSRPHERTAR